MGGGGALTPDSLRSRGGAAACCSSSSRGRYDTCNVEMTKCVEGCCQLEEWPGGSTQ